MEEDQNSSMQEVAPPDQEAVVEQSHPQEQQPSEVVKKAEDKQEFNWKELRRVKAEQDAKLKAQEELIDRLLQAKAPEPKAQEVDEFDTLADDDFLTKKQLEKRIAKQAELIAERKYQEMRARDEQAQFLSKLKSKFSDFDTVVNPDTIAYLEQSEPELAESIAALKDPYKMGIQTYKFLKNMNIQSVTEDKRHAKEVDKKLSKAEKTVQSPQAFDKRPMAQAFQISQRERDMLYEEMMLAARQAGSV